MRKSICLAASLFALNLTPVFGQPNGMPPSAPGPGVSFQQRLRDIQRAASPQTEAPALTKFNLDFPGGTPKELVAAIEKATGKPLNAIIPDENTHAKLPPVKASDLDVAKLFKTLSENAAKYANNEMIRNYGFKTIDEQPSDSSLWTFYSYEKPSTLTQFDIDFPGGTPAQLAKAIEKATGKPLNVIINKEDENIELPPLKMNNVYLPQLFTALEAASRKVVAVPDPRSGFIGSYSQFSSGYGFGTDGTISDDSIWSFYVKKPQQPQLPPPSPANACRFYQLRPYLESGLTVDDITTAIQTGWKMMGDSSPPKISFHKETKLLIAVGEPDRLDVIDNVLNALQPAPQAPGANFQQRLQQIMKNQPQAWVPAPRPSLSPEDQVNLIEQTRKNSQQPPPAALPPPPVKSEAGQ